MTLSTLEQYESAWRPGFLRRPFWRLVTHSGARVFKGAGDSAEDAGDDELDLGVGALLALLAAPSGFITIFLFDKYSSLLRFIRNGPAFDPYAASLPDQYFFLVFSMAITCVVTVIKWESIFPGRRDYMNLAPLPVPARNIFLANLIAVLAIALLFAVDVNLGNAVLFPVIVNMETGTFRQCVEFAAVHGLSVLLASLFVFFGVFALAGLLMTALPRRIFRRVSLYVRVVLIIYAIALLASSSAVPPMITGAAQPPAWVRSLPTVWFLGLSRSLTGRSGPEFEPYAALAVRALAAVFIASLVFYAASYRRHFALIPEAVEKPPGETLWERWFPVRRLHRIFLHTPFQRAFYPFILKTVLRSEKHYLILGGFTGLGLVMAAQRIVSAVSQRTGPPGPLPEAGMLAAPLLLLYCMIFGLRLVFEVPSSLRANWIHRLLVDCEHHESAQVARSAVLSIVLPVIFPGCAFVYAWVWGWKVALVHTLVLAFSSWFLTELLLVKFRKIPFTCSYPHWSEHTVVSALLAVMGLVLFCTVPAEIGLWMMERPPGVLIFIPLWLLAKKLLSYLREQNAYRSQLVFEDDPAPALELLNLSRN